MKNILLVFPVFQALYPKPFESFANILVLAGRLPQYQFAIKVFERMSLVSAMNEAGKALLEAPQHFDAMITFDDDCFPPLNVVERLLARAFDEGHLFVSAAGIMRTYPYSVTAARWLPEGATLKLNATGTRELSGFDWVEDLPHELTPVDFCGVPASITRREVFETLPQPWFKDLDERGERTTHDVMFCKALKAHGIPVLVDGTLRCGHLAEAPVIGFDERLRIRATVETVDA